MHEALTLALPDAVSLLHDEVERLEAIAERKTRLTAKANKRLDHVDERLRYIKQEEDNLSQFWREIELTNAIAELESVAEMLGV